MDELLKYYSRKEVQKSILSISKNREIAIKFADKGYGKRPDVIEFENDVYELAKKGATSFHISEELWNNPLLIKTGMSKKELDNLRIGWDLILDVDGLDLEYSKLAAYYLIEALKFYDIKNVSIKFSGNKGFHIGIPFETFPEKTNQIFIKNLFPEGPRIIAAYLKTVIKEHLNSAVLEKESLNEISKKHNISKEKFDVFNLVDIDSILISSRHLFRSPYSVNEKSGLISIPVKTNNIINFDKDSAKTQNVEFGLKFLDKDNILTKESSELFDKALYWNLKTTKSIEETKTKNIKSYDLPKNAVPEMFFPPCIKIISKGVSDGKKRSLFILINFLRNVGYSYEEAENYITEWNKRNPEKLRENYIKSQLTWHQRQNKNPLPPNCPKRENNLILPNQQNYYTDLGICNPDDFCKLIKNPVNYAIKKQKLFSKKQS